MKKGLFQIMSANIITMVIGILTNFLLPKYLSIESYSMVKTYALYITYAGFFSLGYNDGMYLKYGGLSIDSIDKESIAKNFINYFLLIILMTFLVLIVGLFLKDSIVIAFSFGIFSYNILGYLKSLYQATGEFDLYGKSLNIEKIVIFIVNILLLFLFKSDNSNYYIYAQVIFGILISGYLTYKLEKRLHFIKKGSISLNEIKANISDGFVLMLGNFSSGIFTGLDRWFVKILMDSSKFAIYSFSVSMENIVNIFITPITVFMYNYFCKKPSINKINEIKRYVLLWGFIIIGAAYPAKFILEHFLTKYEQANNIIFLLFGAQAFNIIIKGIYVNIYKSQKRQNIYFFQMFFMLIIAVVLNYAFYCLYPNITSFAFATFITTLIWMIICELRKNNPYRFNISEYLAMFIIFSSYLYTGYRFNSIVGFILYFAILFSVYIVFFNKYIIALYRNYIKPFLGKKNKSINAKKIIRKKLTNGK